MRDRMGTINIIDTVTFLITMDSKGST